MRQLVQAEDLQIIKDKTKTEDHIEVGSVPKDFFYFKKQCFEILDEEILELISQDLSHIFLNDEDENLYSLDDGTPV